MEQELGFPPKLAGHIKKFLGVAVAEVEPIKSPFACTIHIIFIPIQDSGGAEDFGSGWRLPRLPWNRLAVGRGARWPVARPDLVVRWMMNTRWIQVTPGQFLLTARSTCPDRRGVAPESTRTVPRSQFYELIHGVLPADVTGEPLCGVNVVTGPVRRESGPRPPRADLIPPRIPLTIFLFPFGLFTFHRPCRWIPTGPTRGISRTHTNTWKIWLFVSTQHISFHLFPEIYSSSRFQTSIWNGKREEEASCGGEGFFLLKFVSILLALCFNLWLVPSSTMGFLFYKKLRLFEVFRSRKSGQKVKTRW